MQTQLKQNSPEHIQAGKLKANFSSILSRVEKGEEFIMEYGKNHKQVARLIPIETKNLESQLGTLNYKDFYIADNFDDEDDEINNIFYNSDLGI